MKKVGVITLHRVTNYGSVLQTYALQETIKKLGYDVEIIDYRPHRITMMGMLKGLKNKKSILQKSLIIRTGVRIIMIPSYVLRFKCFSKFIHKYLKITKKMYKKESEIIEEDFDYDIYCTGSDQVWNSDWNEKFDGPFYLNFVDDKHKKISYAASFGRENLEKWEEKETKKWLSRYSFISVRELSGIEILKRLGITECACVLDPTLLLNNNEWNKLSSSKFNGKKYILVYNLNRNKKIYKYAENLSKKTGLPVKYISYQLHDFYKYGRMYCNIDVEDFLSLIFNATYVVTDSFHGTAFSINLNKQFIIIFPDKFSTRIKSILKLTGLENRIAKDEFDLDIVNNIIDYDKVNNIISNEREKSIKWLNESLMK